ncbi:tol-pal system protein YbgF [Pseudorhodobacter turbinis]|uniref:Cell division coordinator CpoB n=1 Tax=Pseudorhodobacter turbinis TaxID=2500533 RepID=A0A4P8EHV4_9RHOB|nr:tol-pal system protein YbgF [Pseudorhodobacter turbinis]QCO56518.1 tol-pal system protein YbgF [Pseudorhodobacter turbinis]
MRAGFMAIVLAVVPLAGFAQDRAQTLADIRQELTVLNTTVLGLRRELSTTGGAAASGFGGSLLERVDTIEAALAQLTAKTESLEFRINQVVADGTNRIGDLEFRLVELEGGDLGAIGQTPPLGGDTGAVVAPTLTPPVTGSTSLATNEQADFDRAKGVLGQGDFRTAADLFATFAQTYTGGPLTAEAHYYRGEALSNLGETSDAARAWLEAFSGDMTGARAAESLLKVGQALAELGQGPEACVTLQEVGVRFPGDPAAVQASTAALGLGCQ